MRYILILILAFGLTGCASVPKPVDGQKYTLEEMAREVFYSNYSVVMIPQEDVQSGDLTKVTQAVALYFAQGHSRTTKLLINSSSPKVTAEVIRGALALNSNKSLSRLMILYVGDQQYDGQVKAMARIAGVKYFFRDAGEVTANK